MSEIKKIAIIGGGPAGLATCLELVKTNVSQNFEIDIYDSLQQLGGSWSIKDEKEKYYSIQSTKVFTSFYSETIDMFELDKDDFISIYESNNKLSFLFTILSDFLSNFIDLIKLIIEGLYFTILVILNLENTYYNNITVSQWLIKNKISPKTSQKMLEICLPLADFPDRVLMKNVLGMALKTIIGGLTNPSFPLLSTINRQKFDNKLRKLLEKNHNIFINLNTKIESIHKQDKEREYVLKFRDTEKYDIQSKDYNIVVLATTSNSTIKLLENSDFPIKNNWGNFNQFRNILINQTSQWLGFTIFFVNNGTIPTDIGINYNSSFANGNTKANILILREPFSYDNFVSIDDEIVITGCIPSPEVQKIDDTPIINLPPIELEEIIKGDIETIIGQSISTIEKRIEYWDTYDYTSKQWVIGDTFYCPKSFNDKKLTFTGELENIYLVNAWTHDIDIKRDSFKNFMNNIPCITTMEDSTIAGRQVAKKILKKHII